MKNIFIHPGQTLFKQNILPLDLLPDPSSTNSKRIAKRYLPTLSITPDHSILFFPASIGLSYACISSPTFSIVSFGAILLWTIYMDITTFICIPGPLIWSGRHFSTGQKELYWIQWLIIQTLLGSDGRHSFKTIEQRASSPRSPGRS